MSPKMLKRLGLVIGVFVVFILILFLFASCGKGGSGAKLKNIRTTMVQAAYKYYQKHEDDLPIDDGSSVTITIKKLITSGFLQDLNEATGDESLSCSGEVTVENNNGTYLYTPFVECKSNNENNKIETVYLKDQIIEDGLVENSVGLYAVGNEYIERGEVKNNYILIDEMLYRIIRINEDGTIKVQSEEDIRSVRWDNRYNAEQKRNYGINDYINNDIDSRINEKLKTAYDKMTNKQKAILTTQTLCVGKRSIADTSKDGSTECSQTIRTQLGALSVYEFVQASLDESCVLPTSNECRNYNWLANNTYSGWTVTADADTNFQAYMLNRKMELQTCSNTNMVYPTFNLSSNILYKSGTGTEDDPYIIRYYPVGEEYEEQAKADKKNKTTDN